MAGGWGVRYMDLKFTYNATAASAVDVERFQPKWLWGADPIMCQMSTIRPSTWRLVGRCQFTARHVTRVCKLQPTARWEDANCTLVSGWVCANYNPKMEPSGGRDGAPSAAASPEPTHLREMLSMSMGRCCTATYPTMHLGSSPPKQ